MSETILPCPFCGGRDIEARDRADGTPVVWFVCNDCSAQGPYDDWRANALHRWNTRTSLPVAAMTHSPDGASAGGLAERLRIRAEEHRGLFGSSKDYLLMEEAADALSPSPGLGGSSTTGLPAHVAPQGSATATEAQHSAGKWRKKPVVIEAYQFHNRIGPDERPRWILEAQADGVVKFRQPSNAPGFLLINTLEGQMRADVGDWIIKGVKGELYPCKPDIFEATYEPALSSEAPSPKSEPQVSAGNHPPDAFIPPGASREVVERIAGELRAWSDELMDNGHRKIIWRVPYQFALRLEAALPPPGAASTAAAPAAAAETIVAAAHLYRNAHEPGDRRALPVIVSAPPPARHHNLFIAWNRLGPPQESGFLTSTGRFVDRKTAWAIAVTAGQPLIPREGQGGQLFSEDLW